MLTDSQIDAMKAGFEYSLSKGYPYNKKPYKPTHESNERIRIAYQWLDAQKKIKTINKRLYFPVKHMVEGWCGDYISRDDVEIAAAIHPNIKGEYPDFNISQMLTLPSKKRLAGIDLQGQGYKNSFEYKYKIIEG